MNADLLKSHWDIAKGKLKQEFPELTADDLVLDEDNPDELFRRIEARTGHTREQIEFFFEIECGCVEQASPRIRRGPPGGGTKPTTASVTRTPQERGGPANAPAKSSQPPTPPTDRPAPQEQKPDSMAHEMERSTGMSGQSGGV
jgi:hypothetical protein